MGFFRLQIHLGSGDNVRRDAHFLDALAVGGVDLLHHVDAVKEIGEAVGLKNDLPVGEPSLLLHDPHPFPVLLAELAQILLRGVQLLLGVRNQLTVSGDLFIGGIHLAVQKGDLLVNGALLLHNALHIVEIGIVLALNGIDLLLDLRVFGFQSVNFLLNFRGGCCMGLHRKQAECQRRGQQQGQRGSRKSVCTHKLCFLKQDFCLSQQAPFERGVTRS